MVLDRRKFLLTAAALAASPSISATSSSVSVFNTDDDVDRLVAALSHQGGAA